jgi:hypothetical protein
MVNRKYIQRKMKLNGNATLLDWFAMQKDRVIASKRIDFINSFDNHDFLYYYALKIKNENPGNKELEKTLEEVGKTKQELDELHEVYDNGKNNFWNNNSREVTYKFMELQLDIIETRAKYERQINQILSYN